MATLPLPRPASPGPAHRPRYLTRIEQVPQIPAQHRAPLNQVARRYAFRANSYYLGLIDWTDPADPIRRLIIPRADELEPWGELDPCREADYTVAPGCQHKYSHTALLLCNETCGGYCRYCFRKRLFMNGNSEATTDVSAGLRYIAEHGEITNVLLTGGDPLLLSTRRLRELIVRLRAIPHVQIIRIGSKIPAFDPFRILQDPKLLDLFDEYSTPHKRIYLMAHFDHPRELTDPAVESIDALIRSGVICVNQCPLIQGVNDHPAVLATLFRRLSWIGCPPYYLFQGRPTAGNAPYKVPIVRGWEIFRATLRQGSGLAQRARFVMSHATGKIEIMAVDHQHIYLRYHRARCVEDRGRFMIYKRNDTACWLDDLEPLPDGAGPRLVPDFDQGDDGESE
ncbi:MAG: radical SAM protein [Planctomycetota bacterium]